FGLILLLGGIVLGAVFYLSTEEPRVTPTAEATADGLTKDASDSSTPVTGLDNLRSDLQSGEAGTPELDVLRERLLSMPPEQATAEIRAFLATGNDSALRSEFEIGEGGALDGAPTLRVFLLDLLGQI